MDSFSFFIVDTEDAHEILRAIHKLQSETSDTTTEDYRVDLGTLETISMAAVQDRNVDLNLLVWDLVELFGYQPTEGMFEDVILSFAASKSDRNLFAAMADMEKNGFVPSRTLLRQIAVRISFKNYKRLTHAHNLLANKNNGNFITTSSMNVLLLGYGMKKDINTAFNVYDDFVTYNLKPDANTFSFLMEALYLDSKEFFSPGQDVKPEDIDYAIDGAAMIQKSMNESGIEKSNHFMHEYIRVLCTTGRLDDAKSMLDEAIECRSPVEMGSIVLIASDYAGKGDFEMARSVANSSVMAGCGKPPSFLIHRINKLQRESSDTVLP